MPVHLGASVGGPSPAPAARRFVAMANWKLGTAKVLERKPVETSECKWIGLERIDWQARRTPTGHVANGCRFVLARPPVLTLQDEEGKKRVWESANRSTRSKGGIDAVAILALVSHRSWPSPRVPIVMQYRPPVGKVCVELPAGLIDEGETPEQAAKRELIEECGYGNPDNARSGTAETWQRSGEIVSDPGMSAGALVRSIRLTGQRTWSWSSCGSSCPMTRSLRSPIRSQTAASTSSRS